MPFGFYFVILGKIQDMTTVTINEKTAKGKKLLEFLKTLEYVSFEELKPSPELKQAVNEARSGKVIKTKNYNDLMAKLKA
jgi:hypothetical protein